MKFVLACYGTRGDVEPGAAVGRELLHRGHEVCMAVPPDLIGFVESAGLAAVAFGPDSRRWQDVHYNFLAHVSRMPWKLQDLIRVGREDWRLLTQCWEEASTTMTSLVDAADLLFTGVITEGPAANIAECYDIPLAVLDLFPMRPNGQLVSFLPPPLERSMKTADEWVQRRVLFRKLADAQRRQLGLPKATDRLLRRTTGPGSLEIQAYEEFYFPGLAAEWAKLNSQRPFVGGLNLELPTEVDAEVMSWIAEGTPPIFFGFGSIHVKSPAETLAMIGAACAELGQRALICSGWTDFSHVPHLDHVRVVSAVNHAAILPACSAIVHKGGSGTTAAGLRAGIPSLILWTWGEQSLWGTIVKRLKVGTARRFSSITTESLVADLRTILAPECAPRAREVATRMTKPAESAANTADLLEKFASSRRIG